MKRSDFQFELPTELIAQHPLARRADSRMLHVELGGQRLTDGRFRDLPGLLQPGDLLVFNNTRVIPARLFGRKETGGRVEILIERLLSDEECLAQLRVSKVPRTGAAIVLEGGGRLEVTGRRDAFFLLRLEGRGESQRQ